MISRYNGFGTRASLRPLRSQHETTRLAAHSPLGPPVETIDLRSDTVTRPTPAMRQAIADAEVGDDVIDVDPSVERLEALTADLLGKEAAIFMPSGSMTNQIAIRVHCGRGTEFICEADAHIYHYEQGAFAQLSGLVAKIVAGVGGVLTVAQLRDLIRPDNEHMVRTQLVCLGTPTTAGVDGSSLKRPSKRSASGRLTTT